MKPKHQFSLIFLGLIIAGFLFAAPTPTRAAGLTIDCNQVVTTFEGQVTIDRPCTIQDFFQQFVIIAQFAYSIIVLIGVMMLVYGGYQFLIAAGRQEKISEGKRVITGTIVGLIVSLSAYVIVNFTVAAITGGPTRSLNPFGGIALVFPGDPDLQQPFSGSGGTSTASCHSWGTCTGTFQVYCADTSATNGPVHDWQNKLNEKGCQCGTADGCFGAETIACVRRLQIANFLPPSGVIDQNTANAINSGTRCDGVTPDFVRNISSKLPEVNTAYAGVKNASATDRGCCVVRATVGGTTQPYYCVDSVSQRACVGLGGNNLFKGSNARCATDVDTKSFCGVCKDTQSTMSFDGSGQYWCTRVISPSQIFQAGLTCASSSNCDNGLRSSSPFAPKP